MKKIINHIVLGILASLFLLASNCKKKEEWKTFGPFYLGDLANYVCFKPGTVWIYKNPTTNERDTVTCTGLERDTNTIVEENYHQKIVRESFFTGFKFSRGNGYRGWFYDFKYTAYANGAHLGYKYKIDFGKVKQGSGGGTIVPLFYPFDKQYNPTNIDPNFEFTILISKDTTVTVYGRTFNTVQVFKNTLDGTWNVHPSLYYWAKNYGIIYRKDLKSGEEWYLESETIIQ